jgi:mannose-6-phosphate isomerase-like protein (cupin superfamily)
MEPVLDEGFAKKFATEKETPYTRWVAAEGLDIIGGHYVRDLRSLELRPWDRRGGRGVFINHDASRTSNDCYVCEIPRGGALAPQRQLFEEMILILDGRGSTRVWNDAGKEVTFEWQAGSMFAIPLNTWHQHSNLSGLETAKFVSSTNLPPVLNLYDDVDFVFGTSRDFAHRFNGEQDYFAAKVEVKGLLLDTNFVPDALALPLIPAKERGAGGGHIRFSMAKGSMNSHISEFPVGTYKKGHRVLPHVARRRGAPALRVVGGIADHPAEHVVPPALQLRRRACAVPRVQARGRVDQERARGAEGVDQPARWRRPDRLRGRAAGYSEDLRRRTGQDRGDPRDGRHLRGGTDRPGAGGSLSARPAPDARDGPGIAVS